MTTITAPIHRSPLPAPSIEPSVAVAAVRHAAADPAALAIVDGATGETLTRGELAARSAALAARLRERGIGPGDLVAVSMPNLAWWPVVALGVWRAGAAISPLSPLWTADESARVLAGAVPRLAIAFAPFAGQMREALDSAGLDDVVLAAVGGEAADATPLEALLGSDGDPYAEPDLAARGSRRRALLQRHRRTAQGRAPHARQPGRGAPSRRSAPSAPAVPTTSAP